jgi:hypothetical protein
MQWNVLRVKLRAVPDAVTFPWISSLLPGKDRPILYTAAAWAEVLLTLDRKHFHDLLGQSFYGLEILKPGEFLFHERNAGRLR